MSCKCRRALVLGTHQRKLLFLSWKEIHNLRRKKHMICIIKLIPRQSHRIQKYKVGSLNQTHRGCSTDPGSSREYGEEAHEGRSEGVSKLNQATGKCYGCRRLLGQQTSSRICQETLSKAVIFKKDSISELIRAKNKAQLIFLKLQTRSSEDNASSPTTAFIAWTSLPIA